ncbi:alpha-galactosidase [Microlunatus flavus]|uniref:Alpha-galactosidase n=1 Tax=Microlunatus flavus TaxID=1036181 RepID=A0A1H9NA28_9ACTN|nr:glycoside hydrolase family 36 protein [Microlunatus flavus]SER32597.1 alpha-galactosidase [Microlunatus flavus]
MAPEERLRFGSTAMAVTIAWSEDEAPRLAGVEADGVALELPPGRPLLEVVTVADGRAASSGRLVGTTVGGRARHVEHRETHDGRRTELVLTVADPVTGLRGEVVLTLVDGVPALGSSVRLVNDGTEPVVVRSVASFATHLGTPAGSDAPAGIRRWTLHRALSEWLGEGRWFSEPADATRYPHLGQDLTAQDPRGTRAVVSTGTWSSGTHVPVAAVDDADAGVAWAWQVEHNGAWRYELGEDTADGYLALSGPTDDDHQWLQVLRPGESFTSVPVAVTVAPDLTRALAHLTAHRRTQRRPHPLDDPPRIVFNDYMNTLEGDPTTERLLPLVDAAAAAGAEVFCIDAGWYDDSGHWWPSVGEWQPSRTRFPGGLEEVLDRIRGHGMVPGLWLEPEVVGVDSPLADRLPAEAFLQRAGQRVVENQRFVLDLRHPAARAHLDGVVDRLVGELGVGYFKLDYNVDPGSGTDVDADSPGAGLLAHNRAHLAWLDGVLDRHPALVLENCGSGAMRSDPAMLARLQLQSTSDQQDPLRYAAIAAATPAAVLPEQAASWAYPQPSMSPEEAAFTLVTGLSGRLYLSGHLDGMTPEQLALVTEAVELGKTLRDDLSRTVPCWPLGLPGWDDAWVALGLVGAGVAHLFVWSREPGDADTVLDLRALETLRLPVGDEVVVEQVFPREATTWTTTWSPADRSLRVVSTSGVPAARVLRVTPA